MNRIPVALQRIGTTTTTLLDLAAGAAGEPHVVAVYDLNTIIANITAWIVGILFGVATLFLTVGGLRRLAAGGDPGEIERANSALRSALLGYALALLAPILLGIVRGWIGG